jgi:hypothetical protein
MMKTKILCILALAILIPALFAQTEEDQNIKLKILTQSPGVVESKVYFGIYVQDLDYPTVQELGYFELYGIQVTQVVENSPAWKCGMQADDIIMQVNDSQVTDREEFDRIRSAMEPGDEAVIRIWRNGEVMDLNMVMQPRPGVQTKVIEKEIAGAKKMSAGYGGGCWIPVWAIVPVDDVNELIDKIGDPIPSKGFGANAISEKGVFMNGGAGKGHVGNGFFIGGVGAGYEYKDSDVPTNTKIKYSMSFGGATIEKRIPFTKNFLGSLGLMLGGGGHEVQYSQTQANYTWPEVFTGNNFTATLRREYFVVQPRVELMFRLLPWLGLRAEVGYLYGVPVQKGWTVDATSGDDYNIVDSPDTPFQGLTISAGPWLGF